MAGIRLRASFGAAAVMAGAVTIGSAVFGLLLQDSLLDDTDDRARSRVKDIAAIAERAQLPSTLSGPEEDGIVLQALADGKVISQSAVVDDSHPLGNFAPLNDGIEVHTVTHPPIVEGAEKYRVAATRISTPMGELTIYGAASLEPLTETIQTLVVLLVLVIPLLAILVGAMTWYVVGRTLRPVERIRSEVATISATELNLRVHEPDTRDEIASLAHTMNGMLERLDRAANRQREFVSDAAHELRNPVAVLHTELEVATTYPSTEDSSTMGRRLMSTVERLARLVEDLLLLATAEERASATAEAVDLDEIVRRELSERSTGKDARLEAVRIETTRVKGDPEQLERVVINLIENALRHANSLVAVEVYVANRSAHLVVSDDGPGIAEHDRHRVFGRFVRLAEHRNRSAGGSGLGLSIVKRIVENHGGTVAIDDGNPGTRVLVVLPGDHTVGY